MLPKIMKRYLAFLLAIIMVFSLCPVSVLAAEEPHVHEEENSTNTSDSITTEEDTPVVETTSDETVIVIAEHAVLGTYQTEINRILTE